MLYITLLFATILIILVNCRIVGEGYNDEYLSTDTRLILSAKGINNEIVHLILRNLISVLFVLALIAVNQKVQFTGKTLEWLGNISYELYIVHYVLFSMLSGLNPNVYVVTVLGGGLLLSTLLWKTDKRLIKRII